MRIRSSAAAASILALLLTIAAPGAGQAQHHRTDTESPPPAQVITKESLGADQPLEVLKTLPSRPGEPPPSFALEQAKAATDKAHRRLILAWSRYSAADQSTTGACTIDKAEAQKEGLDAKAELDAAIFEEASLNPDVKAAHARTQNAVSEDAHVQDDHNASPAAKRAADDAAIAAIKEEERLRKQAEAPVRKRLEPSGGGEIRIGDVNCLPKNAAAPKAEPIKHAPKAPAPRPPVQPAAPKVTPTGLEGDVLADINRARTDPAAYARTLHGYPGAAEAVAFLARQPPIAPMSFNPLLGDVAAQHAADQGPRGLYSHTGSDGSSPMKRVQAEGLFSSTVAEEISLSQTTAAGVVGQLIIDATSPGRLHRADLFDPQLKFAGVGCGPNTAFRAMCVIDLTGRINAHIAVGYDCDGGFYDAAGHPATVPPLPKTARTDDDLKRWKASVTAFYQSAYTDPHRGETFKPGRAEMCRDVAIEHAARANDSIADALLRLEEDGR